MEVKELDVQQFNKQYVNVEYPALVITPQNNACTPIIQSGLYKGDLPLIIDLNGTRKLVRRMSESAYNVKVLLDVCGQVTYIDSSGNAHVIKSIEDYLEVNT